MAKKQNKHDDGNYGDCSEWMSRLPPHKLTTPLYDLVLPGSHDSMSYDLDVHSRVVEPNELKKYERLWCVRAIMRRWAKTQESTILDQLNAGVRYFDLRIARKAGDSDPTRLYFYHGLLTRSDVETVLRSINSWAEQHPKEILILALSHFKDFGNDAEKLHQHLINFIKTLFSTKLVTFPSLETPTVQQCWDRKQNVIVSYDYSEATKQPQFWYKIVYFYGNDIDPVKVEEHLAKDLRGASHSYFYVCGLNLTLPENSGALKYVVRHRSLASVVRHSLPKLLQWVEQEAKHTQLNIVASDLVTEDNFIRTIINLNN